MKRALLLARRQLARRMSLRADARANERYQLECACVSACIYAHKYRPLLRACDTRINTRVDAQNKEQKRRRPARAAACESFSLCHSPVYALFQAARVCTRRGQNAIVFLSSLMNADLVVLRGTDIDGQKFVSRTQEEGTKPRGYIHAKANFSLSREGDVNFVNVFLRSFFSGTPPNDWRNILVLCTCVHTARASFRLMRSARDSLRCVVDHESVETLAGSCKTNL